MRGTGPRALTGLAPHLPEPLKDQACQQALAAAQAIRDERDRAEALIGLAPHLPEPLKDQLPQALAAAQAIGMRAPGRGADRPGAAPAGGPAAPGPGRRPGHRG